MNKNIIINIKKQQLQLKEAESVLAQYSVSTALNGAGQLSGSGCTPLGEHCIKIMIGKESVVNSVFVGRRDTGEIYNNDLAKAHPERDWILTRIIWLTGTQSGHNRGAACDTLSRYIYIHGCPNTEPMGTPLSHGCIRMRNEDIIELFDLVKKGMGVTIC